MDFKKHDKEFEQLKKYWKAFSKKTDKKHWDKFSEELIKFRDHLRDLDL
ncbi:MAG: hypothetical protein P0S96_06535 [Simkaniaceae bacterium]|nr:hypothetical protein [Candidatus Sacchlamyda saccharinae]